MAEKFRTGGRILVDALLLHGVDRIFCVPGESFLAVLDALHDTPEIQVVVCRHEGAAANMAEADGKLTGRPGICFVTRGPGATHASVGVHTAAQDSTPLILFVGQVERAFAGREAFQEIDYRRMFAPMAKAAVSIEAAERIPAMVAKAFHTATSGRMGPVVVALPEDVLREQTDAADLSPHLPAAPSPTREQLEALRGLLERSARPLLILGGSGWTEAARRDATAFAEAHSLPVAAAFRRQHLIDNAHPNYVGHLGLGINPRLAELIKTSDLLIALGTRLGDLTTGNYRLIEPPLPHAALVHLYPGAEELGRVYHPTLAIHTGVPEAAAALRGLRPVADPPWRGRLAPARVAFERFTRPAVATGTGIPVCPADPAGPPYLKATEVLGLVEARLPAEAIVTNGAGNFSIWVHRYHRYRQLHSQLAPTSGAMGYGLPAAIAAKLRHPERPVICFAGDGDFLMYPQELITAVRYRLPIIVIVMNNSSYGTIRMHQERAYPGRVIATDLLNPDFAALARAFGISGTTVSDAAGFSAAFERALSAQLPSLIEVPVDPAQLTPDKRL